MFFELIKGVAFLLALCFLQGFNVRLWKHGSYLGQTTTGLLFGGICVVGMHTPIVLEPGIFFDARSVVLSMSGLFGGPLVAAVAACMAIVGRTALGGVGTYAGVIVILLSTLMGLLYRDARVNGQLAVSVKSLLGFGFILHCAILFLLHLLPTGPSQSTFEAIALPFLVTFTLATVMLGWFLRDIEKRLDTEKTLTSITARMQAMAQAIPDALLVIDEHGKYVEVISTDAKSLYTSPARLVGKHMREVLPEFQAASFLRLIRNTIKTGQMHTVEYALETRNGVRNFEGRILSLSIKVDGVAAVLFVARDITEKKESESALRESEIRFRSLLRNIPSVSVQGYRADGTTTYWNSASEKLYGYTEQEAMGSNLLDLIIPQEMHEIVRRDVQNMFTSGQVIPAGELQLRHKDGSLVYVYSSHAFVEVPGSPPEMFCIDIDISGRKAAEEDARFLAFYDTLTQLPNRRLLLERLEEILCNISQSNSVAAVLFVDLDNFKTLNDTRGHEIGDLLLQEVANRLRANTRDQDTVARLGGDEFVILLQNLGGTEQVAASRARTVGEKILAQLRQSCTLAGRQYYFSASIGVALLTRPLDSVDEVLKQADMAMYKAKGDGRNILRFFDPEMQLAVNRRASLEHDMHAGIKKGEFALLFQPQVNILGCVTGAETLLRWHHPQLGTISPAEFIPLAEESGLILPLGLWVMEAAMTQQSCWTQGHLLADIDVAINVSARQFLQDGFVAETLDILKRTGANPARIKLELTESFLLHNIESAIKIMIELQESGLQFSLDDFGTGYSSLNYLKRLPLNQIKIDQGFVRGVLMDGRDATIARSIINLAHEFGIHVIAEGVETVEHFLFLKAHGCTAFQGYLFGRPLPLEEFERVARLPAHPLQTTVS
ncbi:EAL domain-containing protein [Delftia sp. HK171]|uniref:EAL domain-containing protein n=1 Tax=Delftia sp. HK171 TaxID=1920191 RepID=UPI00114E72F5|nr:EAL domain-containing protein [Delftia sp. HK171]TQL81181.1 PAS domain S-box-containing protein/diguanylate cyclase (GGDEF)-like protein [Delftia sp. HK171]